jgi:hypothetical protein
MPQIDMAKYKKLVGKKSDPSVYISYFFYFLICLTGGFDFTVESVWVDYVVPWIFSHVASEYTNRPCTPKKNGKSLEASIDGVRTFASHYHDAGKGLYIIGRAGDTLLCAPKAIIRAFQMSSMMKGTASNHEMLYCNVSRNKVKPDKKTDRAKPATISFKEVEKQCVQIDLEGDGDVDGTSIFSKMVSFPIRSITFPSYAWNMCVYCTTFSCDGGDFLPFEAEELKPDSIFRLQELSSHAREVYGIIVSCLSMCAQFILAKDELDGFVFLKKELGGVVPEFLTDVSKVARTYGSGIQFTPHVFLKGRIPEHTHMLILTQTVYGVGILFPLLSRDPEIRGVVEEAFGDLGTQIMDSFCCIKADYNFIKSLTMDDALAIWGKGKYLVKHNLKKGEELFSNAIKYETAPGQPLVDAKFFYDFLLNEECTPFLVNANSVSPLPHESWGCMSCIESHDLFCAWSSQKLSFQQSFGGVFALRSTIYKSLAVNTISLYDMDILTLSKKEVDFVMSVPGVVEITSEDSTDFTGILGNTFSVDNHRSISTNDYFIEDSRDQATPELFFVNSKTKTVGFVGPSYHIRCAEPKKKAVKKLERNVMRQKRRRRNVVDEDEESEGEGEGEGEEEDEDEGEGEDEGEDEEMLGYDSNEDSHEVVVDHNDHLFPVHTVVLTESPDYVLVSIPDQPIFGSLRVTVEDIYRLTQGEMLNDEIINGFLATCAFPVDTFVLSTFYYPKMTNGEWVDLSKWLKKASFDASIYNRILIPIHLTLHWACIEIAVLPEQLDIYYYNSMFRGRYIPAKVVNPVIDFIQECLFQGDSRVINKGIGFSWQQKDGVSCGIYMLNNIVARAHDKPQNSAILKDTPMDVFREGIYNQLMRN